MQDPKYVVQDIGTAEMDQTKYKKEHPLRDTLGRVGPFVVVDLCIPTFVSYRTGIPLPIAFVGQTLVHYMLGIESIFTLYMLPVSLFPR